MALVWNEKELIEKVRNAVESASREGARDVAQDARTLCPWDTGELATSIEVKKSKFEDGGYLVMAQGPGNYNRFYAAFVELGTHNTAAHPFLRPALRKNKRKIVQNFEGKLK